METAIPNPAVPPAQEERVRALRESLEALLEFTGAAVGWVGLPGRDGRLDFPVRLGQFADGWLGLQRGDGGAWGFEMREGPTLLNELPVLPALGEPPLRNLLSCPLAADGRTAGQVVLANKPQGFTSHDSAVLQGVAHLMARSLGRTAPPPDAGDLPAALLSRALDRLGEGVFLVDEGGRLRFANQVWLRWTGFAAEDLLGRAAPFPFWVSQRDLASVGRAVASAAGPTSLPFRPQSGPVFWCDAEVVREDCGGRTFLLAFLRRRENPAERPAPAPNLPVVGADAHTLLLRPGEPVGGWDPRWEELTGLAAAEVDGAATDLLLDWLFPVQHDRNRVGDLLALPAAESRGGWQAPLTVAAPAGSSRLWCTFLPLGRDPISPAWLLLVGGPASVGGPATGSAVTAVTPSRGEGEAVRADTPVEVPGPHARGDWTSAKRPPGQGTDR